MCVAYEGDDGTRYEHVPYHQSVLHKVRPVYETRARLGQRDRRRRPHRRPPRTARATTSASIEELAGVPVTFVSVGPGREQTVVLPRAA